MRTTLDRLLRQRTAIRFKVDEASDVEAMEAGWILQNEGASIRLVPLDPMPAGLYDLDLAFGPGRFRDVSFELEYDGGHPNPDRQTVPVAYAGAGRYRSFCHVPRPVGAVLVRPRATGHRFEIEAFEVARLGAAASVRILAKRAIALAWSNPRALLPAIRRFRAGVTRGDVIVPTRDHGSHDRYRHWCATFDDHPEHDESAWRERMARTSGLPSFAAFVAVDQASVHQLDRTLASIDAQIYGPSELYVFGPADTLSCATRQHSTRSPAAKWLAHDNQDSAAARNDALRAAQAEWIVPIAAGDLLRPHALLELGAALATAPDAQLIYSDHDHIDPGGLRSAPFFKPDWSPDLLRSWDYLGPLAALRAERVREAAGWRQGFGPASDFDLHLRVIESLRGDQVRHVAKVLSHRTAAPLHPGLPGDTEHMLAGRQAVAEHLERLGRSADVEAIPSRSVLQVRYAIADPKPLVSIIIPTRDRVALLRDCIASIARLTTYQPYEVIVVDNASSDPETLSYFLELEKSGQARVLRDPGPFNFARANNAAARQARGEVLVLLNNDTEVVSENWLEELAGHALRPDIGCVGAKLLYPDGTVQHAGVVVGLGGVAAHAHKGLPADAPGYFGRAAAVCNVSAVTAACLAVRRSVYEEVGGLDEANLAVAFNDVDFCLKVGARGYLNVWTPFAVLTHKESASRGAEATRAQAERFAREIQVLKSRWGAQLASDPFYSRELTRLREDYTVRP
jgi:GT2 family glycosyltransferase